MPDDKEPKVQEETEKPEAKEEEEPVETETVKADAEKHKRLQMERQKRAEEKEKFRDYVRDRLKHDRHLLSRRRKDKHLGGTRGRRGG
ncbi:MAG: hypothetical protein ACE5JC_01535 [Candidatus Zixiibacteriota bacterium]